MGLENMSGSVPKIADPRKALPVKHTATTTEATPALVSDKVRIGTPTKPMGAPEAKYQGQNDGEFLATADFEQLLKDGQSRAKYIEVGLKDSGLTGVARERKAKILGLVFDKADQDGSGAIEGRGEAVALASGQAREARVARQLDGVGAQIAEQARAIAAAEAKMKSGNFVARGFNSFVGVFSRNKADMEAASKNAVRLCQNDLPRDLARYHELIVCAGEDTAKIEAANQFLDGAMAKAKQAGTQFDKAAKAFGANNKFWSGLAADVGSGLMVLGGVALCITGFGAPIGAGMIAGGIVAGGAVSVGAHALLDNQYDIKREGLANFAVGGISAGAAVLTAGMSTGVTATMGRMAIQQGTVGAFTGMAGSVASEASNGWKDGATGRVIRSTVIGGGVGGLLGAGSGVVAQKVITPAMSATTAQVVRTGMGSVSGATGAGVSGVVNEGIDGFKEGWQERLTRQILGGALSGAAYSFGPDLAGRNQKVLDQIAAFKATPNGQALAKLQENFGDFKKMSIRPEILEKGVDALSPKTLKALESAINSKHGSIDNVGAANVDHLASVYGGVLERAFAANGNKPLSQAQVNRLAMETVLTDAWAKNVPAPKLDDFETAPTNAGKTAGEIFAHLKAEAKKAIAAPPGSDLEKLINARIDEGKLNMGILKDPAYVAALAKANLSPHQANALAGRIDKNWMNAAPFMLGTWVHGIPGFDQVKAAVAKHGGSHADAQQIYETVLGHHMAGFIATGFSRGKLELDFKSMATQGQLTPEAANRLSNLYGSAMDLGGKWRPLIDRVSKNGQMVDGPSGEKVKIYSLTAKQMEAYQKAAEPYRKAIEALPENVRSQLLNDDQRQFTVQGLPKWLGMTKAMGNNPNMTNGEMIDGTYRGPVTAYLLENLARGSHNAFIDNTSGPAQRLGLRYDAERHSFQPDVPSGGRMSLNSPVAFDLPAVAMASRIKADPVLGQALQQAITDGTIVKIGGAPSPVTPPDIVRWFRSQPADVGQVMRIVTSPVVVVRNPQTPAQSNLRSLKRVE